MDSTDLDDIVAAWAWEMFDRTKSKEQSKFPRDSLEMHISWKKVRFIHGEPDYQDIQKPGTPKGKILFKTYFENNTDMEQEYSFKTERSTTSSCDVSMESTYTVGQEMNISLKTPCEVFEANAGFHREMSLTNSSGQSVEEELVWEVDSQIKVPPKHRTLAELVISEEQYAGKFAVRSMFGGRIHATITNIRDNNSFVKAIDGNIAEIMRREVENGLKGFKVEGKYVVFNTVGVTKFKYAVEQRVKLNQVPLSDDEE